MKKIFDDSLRDFELFIPRLVGILFFFGVLIGFSLLALLASTSLGWPHSWYPSECCGGQDCFPIKCEEITTDPTTKWFRWIPKSGDPHWGYGHSTHFDFSPDHVRSSQDENCHACISNGNPLCLFLRGTV